MRTADEFEKSGKNGKKSMVTALCLASLILTTPAVRAEKVVVIPLMGATSIGASIFWTGAWRGEENFHYAIGDGMQYDGSSYICVKDHESSPALIPSDDPDHWSLMAEKGDTGPQGPQGIEGPQGPAGVDGAQGPAGADGAQGPQGPQGVQGDTGPAGADGVDGAQGDSGTSSWTDGTGMVTATVDVGIGAGAAIPGAMLHVDGDFMLGATTGTCDASKEGTVRWSGTEFEGCNGTCWLSMTSTVPTVCSATGKVWMDRNLGASQVATAFNDSLSYGDLYQWGRGMDGHEKRASQTTTILSGSANPGHADFIVAPTYSYDWLSTPDNTLWQGAVGMNNPCPAGFRLPTDVEWQAEVTLYGATGMALFNSPLKLSAAGYRLYNDGTLSIAGSTGFYWSSTVDGTNVCSLLFYSNHVVLDSNNRAYGFSVRCIKE